MQIEFLQANGTVWVVKRKFKADSWFAEMITRNITTAEEVCKEYCVEKLLKDNNDNYYLVNEVPEAEIIND
jgi:hypothetical protein